MTKSEYQELVEFLSVRFARMEAELRAVRIATEVNADRIRILAEGLDTTNRRLGAVGETVDGVDLRLIRVEGKVDALGVRLVRVEEKVDPAGGGELPWS